MIRKFDAGDGHDLTREMAINTINKNWFGVSYIGQATLFELIL